MLTVTTSYFSWAKKKRKKRKKRARRRRSRRNNCPKVPIDGGLGILVLGAAAFGVRKLRK
ncbi:MAG: PID-CTERM protein-sorting domain-containing protein [Jejuia sp.]